MDNHFLKTKICASFISLLLMAVLDLPVYTLWIREATEGRKLATIQVKPGDLLKVGYIHSIYNVSQIEIFSIGGDSHLYLEKVTFGSFSAALYYDSEPSQEVGVRNDQWMIKGNGKKYAVLKYRVSPSTGHFLNIGNYKLDLSASFQDLGGLIEIFLDKGKSH